MKTWLIPIQQQFIQQIAQQRLPHALIFQGIAGTGKKALSDWLVQLLLCQRPTTQADNINYGCGACKPCLLFKNNNYPDHKVLSHDKTTIGVDDVRAANTFLEKTAFFGAEPHLNASTTKTIQGKKTVVIENAEKMTVAAANALLKTLEEPSDNSLIILLTSDVDSFLPTIISRCRIINIKPRSNDQTSINVSDDPFANASQWPELHDEIIKEEYNEFIRSLIGYLRSQRGFEHIVAMLMNNGHAWRWFEKIIVNLLRQQQQWQISAFSLSPADIDWLQKIEQQTLWQVYQLLLKSNKQLKSLVQANKQFILEKLLLDCSALIPS